MADPSFATNEPTAMVTQTPARSQRPKVSEAKASYILFNMGIPSDQKLCELFISMLTPR